MDNNLREEKLPAAFLLVFSCGRLAPLLKAPSLFRGQYLQKTIELAEQNTKSQKLPEGVSAIGSGAADVADKLAQHRAGHHSAVAGLQVVRAALKIISPHFNMVSV